MLAIRPEFRSEVVVFAPDDPVFGATVCQVGKCGRVSHGGQVCADRTISAGRATADRT